MQKMLQYCRCKVNLAGQNCHTVIFDEFNAITWPQVQILIALHGDENVMDIMPVGIGYAYPTGEKNRLVSIYGHRVVEGCFPGRNFSMEYMMTDDTDLPYYADGKQSDEPRPPDIPKTPDPPKAPKSDPPGTDHDDGDDDEVQSALPPLPAKPIGLEPIFSPGRSKVRDPAHKGA